MTYAQWCAYATNGNRKLNDMENQDECGECAGTGCCGACEGMGTDPYSGGSRPCSECDGDGCCGACEGTGANDMICPIVKAPNSILNGVCIDIEIGPHTYASEIAKDLIDTCYANAGAGLAAPQIHCALRIIVIRDDNGYAVMCNPEIVRRGKQVDRELEGCLSLPGQRFVVERNRIITVQWRDLNNNLHEQVMKGHPARVVQHEIDHLDGVLIG